MKQAQRALNEVFGLSNKATCLEQRQSAKSYRLVRRKVCVFDDATQAQVAFGCESVDWKRTFAAECLGESDDEACMFEEFSFWLGWQQCANCQQRALASRRHKLCGRT